MYARGGAKLKVTINFSHNHDNSQCRLYYYNKTIYNFFKRVISAALIIESGYNCPYIHYTIFFFICFESADYNYRYLS